MQKLIEDGPLDTTRKPSNKWCQKSPTGRRLRDRCQILQEVRWVNALQRLHITPNLSGSLRNEELRCGQREVVTVVPQWVIVRHLEPQTFLPCEPPLKLVSSSLGDAKRNECEIWSESCCTRCRTRDAALEKEFGSENHKARVMHTTQLRSLRGGDVTKETIPKLAHKALREIINV
jgi:hypothetical protein